MKHTPTPWQIDPLNYLSIIDSSGDVYSGLILQTNGKKKEEALANRDRIIECVNALSSIDNPKKWVEQVKQLIETDGGDKVRLIIESRRRIAELEEALRELTNVISGFAGVEAWVADTILKKKWQSKIYPAIEKAKSLLP